MWSVTFPASEFDEESLLVGLWEHGTLGVIEEAGALRAFFEDSADLAAVQALRAGSETAEIEDEEAHSRFRREEWDPILVGERFYIAPAWVKQETPVDRIRLAIGDSAAFGTGRHETTQLCLRALERALRPGSVVLDVGCGSGILSMAAALLGARQVFSCDIDEESIKSAREQVATPVFAGSVDAMEDGSVDLVLANISAAVLDRLAFDLLRVVNAGGLLVISGFLHEKLPECYQPMESLEEGDWLCWICGAKDVTPRNSHAQAEGLSHKAEW